MKFVTFQDAQGERKVGWTDGQSVFAMDQTGNEHLPDNMLDLIRENTHYLPIAEELSKKQTTPGYALQDVEFMSPLPNPPSVRDFMAFEEHVQNALGSVAPEWYELPAFYFTNHLALYGTDQKVPKPANCGCLDYELEIACIIGKKGINIKAEEADNYIFGYTILNDWSARDLQMKEMKVGLGPAKGKDFATSTGPWIVTKDELESFREDDRFHLDMTAKVNGKLISKGNAKDIYHTFAAMIERASTDVTLYPGDMIGSGTVGTGCLVEQGPDGHPWLKPGDEVEMEATGLGVLRNVVEG